MAEEKIDFKPGNMLYPVPAVLVGCADREWNPHSERVTAAPGADGKPLSVGEEVMRHCNLFTVAWTGTVCTNPPMLSIPSGRSATLIT